MGNPKKARGRNKGSSASSRRERLAAALRANLKKRRLRKGAQDEAKNTKKPE